jgi:hypothetical protein
LDAFDRRPTRLLTLADLFALPHYAYTFDRRLILGLGAVPAVLALVLRTRTPEVLRDGGSLDVGADALCPMRSATA